MHKKSRESKRESGKEEVYGFEDIDNFVKVKFYFKDIWKLKKAFDDFVNIEKKNRYYIENFDELMA